MIENLQNHFIFEFLDFALLHLPQSHYQVSPMDGLDGRMRTYPGLNDILVALSEV
jgi:hypothetical protein